MDNIFEKLKRLIVLTLIFAMVFTYLPIGQLGEEVFAELPTMAPDVTIGFSYLSGGTIPTDREGKPQKNTVLVGRNGAKPAIIDLKMDASFQSGKIHSPYFTLSLPYLYIDSKGQVVETFDASEVPASQKDAAGKPLMGVRASVVDSNDYDVDTNDEFRGAGVFVAPGDSANRNVIMGDFINVPAGESSTVKMKFDFYGNVPENAVASAALGGGYVSYEDNGEIRDYNNKIAIGASEDSKFTFICSNLEWETSIKQVSENVLWDKYNYMVYEVGIKNTSEDDMSVIDKSELSLEIPMLDAGTGSALGGARLKDIAKWLYKGPSSSATPEENKDPRDTDGKTFTGVPGDGGGTYI